MAKTAGIIIIGDEVLSGKFQDANSPFMAKELRLHGVDLRRISTIPDDIDEISKEVRSFSDRFDYVFTTGGIGPTHDDITIEGIAKGFDVPVVIDDYLRKLLENKYGTEGITPERLKMAHVPEGAELVADENTYFPFIQFKNVFIFPGIPGLLQKKFLTLTKRFNDAPLLLRKVFLTEWESEVAPLLNEVVRDFDDVKIGSYPFIDNKEYRVMLTFESYSSEKIDGAVNALTALLAPEKVFKIQ